MRGPPPWVYIIALLAVYFLFLQAYILSFAGLFVAIVGNVVIDGKGIGKEGASETVTRNREKKCSREQRSAEKNRERVHLQRVVSVKKKIEFNRKDI